MEQDLENELLAAVHELHVVADKESTSLMLTTYRGAIDVIRRGVVVGASHDPDQWQGFLEAVSQIVDALEPMEVAFWEASDAR